MRKQFKTAIEKGIGQEILTRDEVLLLIQPMDNEERKTLFWGANQVRADYMGPAVHLRGIIEFSNYCESDCLYCGLRRSNQNVKRYRLTPEEILTSARKAKQLGYRTVVLQSGEDFWYDKHTLADIILKIKNELKVAVTMSVGERDKEDYAMMREAGADRYLIKHETADPELFLRLRPKRTLSKRLDCLNSLRDLGFQIGSGNMVGLPGQTIETLADDLLLMRELDVEMAGIGPFIPHPQTPLGEFPKGDVELSLKAVAVARLLLPQTHLPATTALGTLDKSGWEKALNSGANVIMPNLTPLEYREKYEIYPGKRGNREGPVEETQRVRELIHHAGRSVAADFGHSPKFNIGEG